MAPVASLLAMDRTTLTAALKLLERRGLVTVNPDPLDRRSRILCLTPAGHELLLKAVPVWEQEHRELEKQMPAGWPVQLRETLHTLR